MFLLKNLFIMFANFIHKSDMNVLGRDLLDWLGLGTGPDTDPYLARTNEACLTGDLAECFKSRALSSLDEFFNKVSITCQKTATK